MIPTRSPLPRWWGVVAALVAAAALSGCTLWPHEQYPYTTTDPMSDFGWQTHRLYVTVTWIVSIIFVAVSALLAYVLVRFRDDGKLGNPEQIHGNLQMEIGWTLLPIGIVLVIIIPTVRTVFKIADAPPAGAVDAAGAVIVGADGKPEKPTVNIEVVGRRWWWEFRYKDSGIVTGNQMVIPDDRPVSLTLTSDTVIHSFWLPRVGGKRDAVPGRVNRIWFKLDQDVKPGEIEHIRGECAEYCGESHSLMRLEALALDGADYEKWETEMQAPIAAASPELQKTGEAAFQEAGCIGCHTITGNVSAAGKQGPNLTAFGDRRWLAAGVHDMYPQGRENTETAKKLLTQWIRDPNALKPGTTKSANPSRSIDGMNIPADRDSNGILTSDELSDEKVAAIVDYLLTMKTSFPLR